jgi:hypothetical protein
MLTNCMLECWGLRSLEYRPLQRQRYSVRVGATIVLTLASNNLNCVHAYDFWFQFLSRLPSPHLPGVLYRVLHLLPHQAYDI